MAEPGTESATGVVNSLAALHHLRNGIIQHKALVLSSITQVRAQDDGHGSGNKNRENSHKYVEPSVKQESRYATGTPGAAVGLRFAAATARCCRLFVGGRIVFRVIVGDVGSVFVFRILLAGLISIVGIRANVLIVSEYSHRSRIILKRLGRSEVRNIVAAHHTLGAPRALCVIGGRFSAYVSEMEVKIVHKILY